MVTVYVENLGDVCLIASLMLAPLDKTDPFSLNVGSVSPHGSNLPPKCPRGLIDLQVLITLAISRVTDFKN
jgi:hypothetical protein